MTEHSAVSATAVEPRRICIVGFADGHKHQAPYDEDGWEFWGINRLHVDPAVPADRYARWFNLHDIVRHHGKDAEHLDFLATFAARPDAHVFLRAEDLDKVPFPAVPFPRDRLVARFGNYFNNTISWLISLAIDEGATEIALYGVDMATDSVSNAEYSHQRPSCEYFLGIAQGLGIRVRLPEGSDLLKAAYLYGFEEGDVWTAKLMARLGEVGKRKEAAKAELAKVDNTRAQLIAAINQLDGAMQDVQYWLRNWAPNPPTERKE